MHHIHKRYINSFNPFFIFRRSHEKDDSNNLQLKKPVRTYSKGGSKSSQAKNKNPTNKLPTGAALIPNWPPATVSTPKRRQVAVIRSF